MIADRAGCRAVFVLLAVLAAIGADDALLGVPVATIGSHPIGDPSVELAAGLTVISRPASWWRDDVTRRRLCVRLPHSSRRSRPAVGPAVELPVERATVALGPSPPEVGTRADLPAPAQRLGKTAVRCAVEAARLSPPSRPRTGGSVSRGSMSAVIAPPVFAVPGRMAGLLDGVTPRRGEDTFVTREEEGWR